MNDAALFEIWYMSLALATVIVIAAAGLLIAVWMAARRILRLAVAALGLVKQIKANTQTIWALEDTNKTAVKILETAKQIHEHGGMVAEALHAANAEEV